MLLPKDDGEWLHQTVDRLLIKRCAYWKSLRGMPDTENTTSVTIRIATAQIFDAPALNALMEKSRQGALMKALIVDPVALRAISPVALRGYATFEGWKRVEPYGENSEVYLRRKGDQSSEIILPVTEQLGDYPSIVAQLISIFAKEADKEVIDDLPRSRTCR